MTVERRRRHRPWRRSRKPGGRRCSLSVAPRRDWRGCVSALSIRQPGAAQLSGDLSIRGPLTTPCRSLCRDIVCIERPGAKAKSAGPRQALSAVTDTVAARRFAGRFCDPAPALLVDGSSAPPAAEPRSQWTKPRRRGACKGHRESLVGDRAPRRRTRYTGCGQRPRVRRAVVDEGAARDDQEDAGQAGRGTETKTGGGPFFDVGRGRTRSGTRAPHRRVNQRGIIVSSIRALVDLACV